MREVARPSDDMSESGSPDPPGCHLSRYTSQGVETTADTLVMTHDPRELPTYPRTNDED